MWLELLENKHLIPTFSWGTVAKRATGCISLLILSFLHPLFAQEKEYFPFYTSDTTRQYELAVALRTSLQKHLVTPPGVSSAYKHSYHEIVADAAESSYRRARHYAFLDDTVDPYIQSVFREVVSANGDLPATRLVLTRSPVENAYALGDGTVFFNIGLLAKLENESQIAFIICHELAHIQLKHMERGIKESLDVLHDKNFRKQVKQTSKEKYSRQAKMGALFEEVSLNRLHHRRSFEKQADSLGYLLLSKTRYNTADAYTALQVLDSIDEPYAAQEFDFESLLGCPNFNSRFKTKKKPASIFDVAETAPPFSDKPDTLKTHPDGKVRMRFIQELQTADQVEKSSPYSQRLISAHIRDISRREVVQSYFDIKRYDHAFFNALLLLREQPGSTYLQSMVMLCLYELRHHLQTHRFSEVVAVESKYQPENFNQLLRVLHNLNTSDFKAISSCFAQTMQSAQEKNEHALAAQYALAVLRDETALAGEFKKTYHTQYRQGRFVKTLFPDGLK